MTLENFLWVIGITILPIVGFAIRLYYMTNRLLDMHEHPEKTGFGTVGHAETLDKLANAVEALTSYLEGQEEKDNLRRKLLLAEIRVTVADTLKKEFSQRPCRLQSDRV